MVLLRFALLFLLSGVAFGAERFVLKDGTSLELFVKCPRKLESHSYPVVALFGGFETGARAIELLGDQKEFCLLTFQYPFEGPRRFTLWSGLQELPKARRALHTTISGVSELIDWIKEDQRFDQNRIVLVGASFGAPFVSYAAGDRDEVKALILVHGFADVSGVIAHRLERNFGSWASWILAKFFWFYAGVSPPEDFLVKLRSHQKVFLLTAENDDLLPKQAVEKLREAVDASAAEWEEKKLPGAHVRPDENKLIATLLMESLAWLRKEKILR